MLPHPDGGAGLEEKEVGDVPVGLGAHPKGVEGNDGDGKDLLESGVTMGSSLFLSPVS